MTPWPDPGRPARSGRADQAGQGSSSAANARAAADSRRARVVAGTLHDTSHALAGTATFAVFGAAALAGLFLAGYAGLAVPVVALGLATQLLSARVAVLGFAVLLVAVVALVSRRLLRT